MSVQSVAMLDQIDALAATCATLATEAATASIDGLAALTGRLVALRSDVRDVLDEVDSLGPLQSSGVPALTRVKAVLFRQQARAACVEMLSRSGELLRLADEARSRLPRRRTHVVRVGETLQSIARDELGDWQAWARIADANGLDPAATLTPGASLLIPATR